MPTEVLDQEPPQALQRSSGGVPEAVAQRGMNISQWRALFALFPGAKPDTILLVYDYCKARHLDPFKKPCHIVPMRVKVGNDWVWRDQILPGIYEYRITAHRTGLYLGHTKPTYGPLTTFLGVRAPEWCELIVIRWSREARERVEFPVRVLFSEVVATFTDRNEKTEKVNDRWSRAPVQMLTKCTEAAGLREAFPEEIGGLPTAEEMQTYDSRVELEPEPAAAAPPPPVRRSLKSVQEQPEIEDVQDQDDEDLLPVDRPPATNPTIEAQHAADRAAASLRTAPPDFLENELPEPAAPAPAKRERTSAAATSGTPAPARPQSRAHADSGRTPSSGISGTHEDVAIIDTNYQTPKGEDAFYEIIGRVQREGTAPVGYPYRTTDKALYELASSAEGTGQLFRVTWSQGERPDGSKCKIIESLAAM
jgi:phage recombination protein Bet